MEIEDEISQSPQLKNVLFALVDFIKALQPFGYFKNSNKTWVYEPSQIVSFYFYKGKQRGEVKLQFKRFPDDDVSEKDRETLDLYGGRYPNYYGCDITSPKQLAVAAKYIGMSFQHNQKF